MQSASAAQLRKELLSLPKADLVEICNRLLKHKKENKELISYLLYESTDEKSYVLGLKELMDEMFEEVNLKSMHWAKKTIRKILRWVNKYAAFSLATVTRIDLLIYFCKKMKALPLDYAESASMRNLYQSQIVKIDKFMTTLHEDLRYDYQVGLEELRSLT